ncbi:MAG: DUF1569 domain-containing protein [Pirellulaceae bacterium]
MVERRQLRFATLEDLLEEVQRIETADKEGHLQAVGTWTPGQIMGHVAAWIDYGYDGYPMEPPPWFIRLLLRWQVKKYLRVGMPSGVRIPKVEAGTYGIDRLSLPEGVARLRRAVGRLRAGERATFPSPAFGPLSPVDWIQLNLRHAELHLSYLQF